MMMLKLMVWAFVAFSVSGCAYFVYAIARDVMDRRAAARVAGEVCPVRGLRR